MYDQVNVHSIKDALDFLLTAALAIAGIVISVLSTPASLTFISVLLVLAKLVHEIIKIRRDLKRAGKDDNR